MINDYFNRIIDEVNERRNRVLANFRDIHENIHRNRRTIKRLEEMKIDVETTMTHNKLRDQKENYIQVLDKNRIEDVDYQFVFYDKKLKEELSNLGVLEKSPKHYLSKSFMKYGFEIPVESETIGKFSVDEETQIIAINNPNDKEIMYFDISELSLVNCFSLKSNPTVCEIEIINLLYMKKFLFQFWIQNLS